MSQALQSAQKSLQQAGQQQDGEGRQGAGESESSEEEMGEEFQPGRQARQGGGKPGGQGSVQLSGGGMGNEGRGAGGSAGPQQPLPGPKKDRLVRGAVDPKGRKLQRTFKGTPDPTQDRAAYYSVVPDKLRAAEASLNREEIPAGHKKQVRDYFEAIQPSR